MAFSSLPSNLWWNRQQCWPYFHRVQRRFPLCLHLPHLPPPDALWFRISSLYQQESCEDKCGAGSDEVSNFVWLCHTRREAGPYQQVREVSCASRQKKEEKRVEKCCFSRCNHSGVDQYRCLFCSEGQWWVSISLFPKEDSELTSYPFLFFDHWRRTLPSTRPQ